MKLHFLCAESLLPPSRITVEGIRSVLLRLLINSASPLASPLTSKAATSGTRFLSQSVEVGQQVMCPGLKAVPSNSPWQAPKGVSALFTQTGQKHFRTPGSQRCPERCL